MARNLTPDANGLPEGLTETEFVKVLRTGEDIYCEKNPLAPICALGPPTPLLQVMPWPTYHSMTDIDLKSIYAYLRALPAANACNTSRTVVLVSRAPQLNQAHMSIRVRRTARITRYRHSEGSHVTHH